MIRIIEVSPRDGLQNEKQIAPTRNKVKFIDMLSKSGVNEIEVSGFISPKMIPQLKDAEAVFQHIQRNKNITYSGLVPNLKGYERAINSGADKVCLFTAASETFNQKNIHTTFSPVCCSFF